MHQQADADDIQDFEFDFSNVGGTDVTLNDDGTITIIIDDDGSQPFAPAGGGNYQPAGGNQGTGGVFAPTGGTINVNVAKSSATPKLNFIQGASTVKTDISYVIVLRDGSTLELTEKNPITPKEMIGITKFINTVSSYLSVVTVTTLTGNNKPVEISWSMLIHNLNIVRHFTAGGGKDSYDTTGDTIYVFLNDA
jgi:hypothetical protein